MHAYARFRDWVFATADSQADVAKRLGCSQSRVSRIINGLVAPDLATAVAIELATEGWEHGPILAREWAVSPSAPATTDCPAVPATHDTSDSTDAPAAS